MPQTNGFAKDFTTQNQAAVAYYDHTKVDYNKAQLLIAETFKLLGMDKSNEDTDMWNPLGVLINTGDTVLLKPNLIKESHISRTDQWEQIVTHPAIIKAVLHYVFKALNGTGKVIVADGPQTDSSFSEIYKRLDLGSIKDECYKLYGQQIDILDLREEEWIAVNGVIKERIKLKGDPKGYLEIDLQDASEFSWDKGNKKYYGAEPNYRGAQAVHTGTNHSYRVSASVLESNVVINLPKLKTHKKTGVTLSLKNLVGIHGDRNRLPHHSMGIPAEGGDEFPSSNVKYKIQSILTRILHNWMFLRGTSGLLEQYLKILGYKIFGKTESVIRSGNWYGNNTTWRMALDLNKILFYADRHGVMHNKQQRRYLTIIDGIIAGDGNGPMAADPRNCGLIVTALNPVASDCIAAHIMGFDINKIPIIYNCFKIQQYPLSSFNIQDINSISNNPMFNKAVLNIPLKDTFIFKPHFGWNGHIELT